MRRGLSTTVTALSALLVSALATPAELPAQEPARRLARENEERFEHRSRVGPEDREGEDVAPEEVVPLPENDPDTEADLALADLSVSAEQITLSVHVGETADAFYALSFGVASLRPGVLEAATVEIGAGLASYVAQNGEPPLCDIVIYPSPQAAVGSITKLFADAPYDSALYGTEILRISYVTRATRARETTLQVFTSDDMEWVGSDRFVVRANDEASLRVELANAERTRHHLPGDVDADACVGMSDAIAILGAVVRGRPLACAAAADIDRDGQVLLTDAILLLGSLVGDAAHLSPLCQPTPDDAAPCPASTCR